MNDFFIAHISFTAVRSKLKFKFFSVVPLVSPTHCVKFLDAKIPALLDIAIGKPDLLIDFAGVLKFDILSADKSEPFESLANMWVEFAEI